MLVVDASVIAPVVADGGPDGKAFRARLRGESIAGPDLLRIEVSSALQRQAASGLLTAAQVNAAFEDLLSLPIAVHPSSPFLRRIWALRGNISSYDACYVALAEALDCPLLTADNRLASTPGVRCPIEVV